jgi:hypothetical protein
VVKDGFGHDGTRRISSAKKKHVVASLHIWHLCGSEP